MRTTQRKGDIATTQAIATFTALGHDVSIPVTESAAYDLIVDDGAGSTAGSASAPPFQRAGVRGEADRRAVVRLALRDAARWVGVPSA